MLNDSYVISKNLDYYQIKDNIIKENKTYYLSINLKNSLVELLDPIDILKFIDINDYIFINSKIIFNSNENIIKELSNKINFKTSFSIKKTAEIDEILKTDVIIDDEISDILIKYFNVYILDEIVTISKIVSTIRNRNSASSITNKM